MAKPRVNFTQFPVAMALKSMLQHQVQVSQLQKCSGQSPLSKRQQQVMGKGLPPKKKLPGVKHIVLVASGKGGVGKSTTAVNVAAAAADVRPNLRVGLLDADVFGPSIPMMMNLSGEPLVSDDKLMIPLMNYGVKCMSLGFMVARDTAVMWRGLMVMQAINKLMFEVDWGPTDVLFVDTPPGTGDTHLSLIQNLFISGALVVTTPQQMALEVTRRGVSMFRRLEVPVIGVVQNMGAVICSECSHKNNMFGPAINTFAKDLGIEVVQDIPIHPEISMSGDMGQPVVISHPNSPVAESYRNLACRVLEFLKIEDTASQKI